LKRIDAVVPVGSRKTCTYRGSRPRNTGSSSSCPETPWLGLVVSVLSQSMFVDGYKSPDARRTSDVWRTWQGNKFDARQIPLHRAALAYGYSFETVLPGQAPDGSSMASDAGRVPDVDAGRLRRPLAEDDWPMYRSASSAAARGAAALRVYDEEFVYYLSCTAPAAASSSSRPARTTPACARSCGSRTQLDLEGRAPGEIEPFIGLAARINKTDYDRMLTQHFASWKVRYIAGMARPDDDEQALNLQKINFGRTTSSSPRTPTRSSGRSTRPRSTGSSRRTTPTSRRSPRSRRRRRTR
jgi:hypothetical protein